MLREHTPAVLHTSGAVVKPRPWAVVRLLWFCVAVLVVVLVVAGAPHQFAFLTRACPAPACDSPNVTPQELSILAAAGISHRHVGTIIFAANVLLVVACLGISALISWQQPRDGVALLGAFMLLTWGASASDIIYTLDRVSWLWWPPVHLVGLLSTCTLTYFCYLFPSGQFSPRWLRVLPPLWIGVDVALNLVRVVFPMAEQLYTLWKLFFIAWTSSMIAAQLHSYRQSPSQEQRQQTRWIVFALVVVLGSFCGLQLVRLGMFHPAFVARPYLRVVSWVGYYTLLPLVPLAFGIAILRDRLWALDVALNRTLVYGMVTVAIVGLYVLVVGTVNALLHTDGQWFGSLLATGLVAVLFAPLRERVQSTVNRLLYGERDNPHVVIEQLSRQLAQALEPDAVLPTIVETVRTALKLPYVAVAVDQANVCVAAAASGEPVPELLRMPLMFQGEAIGTLIIGPRGPGERWSALDQRLLANLCAHAGTAVHAVRLTLELQQARVQLVTAREEERRRLGRDLHDGLGPTLASLTMQLETVRLVAPNDLTSGMELLREVQTELKATIGGVRQLVYALRPPALDQFGLMLAIQEHALRTLTPAGIRVELDLPEPPLLLPAATEVAAYYIAIEALTNVVRHAQASTCTVRMQVADHLHLDIKDNGIGMPARLRAGVGIQSMCERARELGGTWSISAGRSRGTHIHVVLPLGS